MKRWAGLGCVAVLLVGCAGAQPAKPAPSVVQVAPDDPCSVLTAEDLNAVLGTEYETGEEKSDDVRQIVTCTYTTTENVAGTDLPVSITDVGVSLTQGAFETNRDLAPAYFGGDPEGIQVDGADEAYVVINEQTQSPVVGLQVEDLFILIQIGEEGATVEQAQQLAGTAASRIS